MKGKTFGTLFVCLLFFFICGSLKAQETQQPPLKFQINSGYTFPNVAGNSIATQGSGSNGGAFNTTYLEIGYSYSKKGVISLYLSDAGATTGNYTWLDTTNAAHTYYYSVNILTMGLSSIYYLANSERFCPYIGLMLGYHFVNFIQNGEYPAIGSANVTYQSLSYQAYVGTSYYFVKWCGLDLRLGYGNNYYASIGLSFKFQANQGDD